MITIYTNLNMVNFLDVTRNLGKGTDEPYKNITTHQSTYTLFQTSCPQLSNKPKSLSAVDYLATPLTSIFFNKRKHIYHKALKHNGYRQALEFIPAKDKSKHRSRNIIWFNPPYNKCITSNIGRDFLNLISKHFPNNNPLAKIFNNNNVKVTYSCTNNMSQIITKHKKNCTHQQYGTPNCWVKSTSLLLEKCLYKNVIYKATVKTINFVKHYIVATEGTMNKDNLQL